MTARAFWAGGRKEHTCPPTDAARRGRPHGRSRWTAPLGSFAGICIAVAILTAGCPGHEPSPQAAEPSTPAAEHSPPAAESQPATSGAEAATDDGTESSPPPAIDPQERADEREAMVREQLAGRDIGDGRVLAAMRRVLRHRLIPEEVQSSAYADAALPIGYGQTISQPYMVALMSEKLALGEKARVLEIGTGSGYQAAVLAEMGVEVYTTEIVKPLAQRATQALTGLGYDSIHVKNADGYFGWEEHGPFDGIIVTAAASHVPPPLLSQLKDGGRLVIPLGDPLLWQTLTIIQRTGEKRKVTYSTACTFVPMKGKIETK